jgi:hypothetical protein
MVFLPELPIQINKHDTEPQSHLLIFAAHYEEYQEFLHHCPH